MKTIKKLTRLFEVDNVKLFPIKEDTELSYKCGDGIDLSGVTQISLTYEFEEKRPTNDCSVFDVTNRVKSVAYEMEYAKLTSSIVEKLKNQPQQLKAQIFDTSDEGGVVHFCIYKVNAEVTTLKEEDDCITCVIKGKGEYSQHKFQRRNTKQSRIIDIEIYAAAKDLEATEETQMTKLTQTGSHVSQEFNGSLCQDLSKKLCEIVGIEQKYQLNGVGNTLCSQKEIDEYSKEINYPDGAWVEIYPDFGQSENFVKLLEIAYEKSIGTGTSIGAFRNKKKSFKECFFERLFARLEKLGNCYAGKDFKQAIREAEWKYE